MEKKAVKQKSGLRSQESGVRRPVTRYLLLVTCYLSLVTAAQAISADELVDNIQKKLSGMQDMRGSFTQTSYLKDLDKTETYAGTFFIKKPSGIMWEYKTPRDEKVIINGVDTWIYRRSQKQAVRSAFSKEAYSQVPLALLNSLENLRVDFDVTLPEQDTLRLRPKRQMGPTREISIKTSATNFPVKTLKVSDTYGNVITIELENIKTNTGLDSSLFTFTAPQGVEVFDMSK